MKLPEKFLEYLSQYKVVQTNGGEPVGWGYYVQKYISPELWDEFKTFGTIINLSPGTLRRDYVLVTDWLSFEDAVAKYGPVTSEEFGPLGGWRSTTLGTTEFFHSGLRPIWNRKRPPKESPSTTESAPKKKRTRKTPKKPSENKA